MDFTTPRPLDTQTDYPRDCCLHDLFEAQVERTPESAAVVFEEQQLTFRQLNERANQLAHRLRSLGVGPDQVVGICLERSVEMVVGLLGILKAGAAYLRWTLRIHRSGSPSCCGMRRSPYC